MLKTKEVVSELVEPVKYSAEFRAGDRVKVIAATNEYDLDYVGLTGTLITPHLGRHGAREGKDYNVKFDDGSVGNLNEATLQLVSRDHEDFSAEYEAIAFLLRHGGDDVREFLVKEVKARCNSYLGFGDYKNVRRAIDLLERLEK